MALGEGKSALFGLFTNESANVFDPVSTVLLIADLKIR
jgi:hypothetical protein